MSGIIDVAADESRPSGERQGEIFIASEWHFIFQKSPSAPETTLAA